MAEVRSGARGNGGHLAGLRRSSAGGLGLALGLAFGLALGSAEAFAADGSLRLAGKVRALGPDALEVRARGKTYAVHLAAKDAVALGEAGVLAKIGDGDPLVVLGRRQEPVRDPNTQMTQPAQVVQIQTIVGGPAVAVLMPEGQDPKTPTPKLTWLRGSLKRSAASSSIKLGSDEINLQWGPTRKVLLVQPAERSALKKGALVIVVGVERRGGKARHLDDARVLIVDRRVPGALLAPILR